MKTPDVEKATAYLSEHGINTCDELEEIPDNCHWITDPSGTVFIVSQK